MVPCLLLSLLLPPPHVESLPLVNETKHVPVPTLRIREKRDESIYLHFVHVGNMHLNIKYMYMCYVHHNHHQQIMSTAKTCGTWCPALHVVLYILCGWVGEVGFLSSCMFQFVYMHSAHID